MGGSDVPENKYAKQLGEITKRNYYASRPTQGGVMKSLQEFLGVPYTGSYEFSPADLMNVDTSQWDYTKSPAWAPGKMSSEIAYRQAQQNALANLPAGGVLDEAMMRTELDRARNLTNLGGQIGQDMWNKAFGVATQSPGQTMQGLGGAASAQAAANQAAASEKGAKSGALGSLGTGVGYMLGGPLGGALGSGISGLFGGGK